MINVQGLQNWVPDENAKCCSVCSASFGLLTRRHHCRGCGRVACGKCLKKASIYGKSAGPQLTCQQCYNEAASVLSHDASNKNAADDKKKASAVTKGGSAKCPTASSNCATSAQSSASLTAPQTTQQAQPLVVVAVDDDGWDDAPAPSSQSGAPTTANDVNDEGDDWDAWDDEAPAAAGAKESTQELQDDDWD